MLGSKPHDLLLSNYMLCTVCPGGLWLLRQVAALRSDHYRQVPLVGAGCCRQVAALHSDHYRQVPLVGLVALDRGWLL